MQKYIMAGISGYRPQLRYSVTDERCLVTFSGYGEDIAILPINTKDAVLSFNGMLAYLDDKNEARGLQIPNHEKIISFLDPSRSAIRQTMTRQQALSALGASIVRKPNMQDAVEMIYRDAIKSAEMTNAVLDANSISADKIVSRSQTNVTEEDADKIVSRSLTNVTEEDLARMIRPILETHVKDMTRRYIDPLRRRIAQMAEENRRMAIKLDELEGQKNSPSSALISRASEIIKDESGYSVSWGDRAGLPGGAVPDGNPFVSAKPRR